MKVRLGMNVSRPEENQVHGLLRDLVEFIEMLFADRAQLIEIRHFQIATLFIFRIAEIAIDQTAQIVFADGAGLLYVQVSEQLVEILAEDLLGRFDHLFVQPLAIVVVSQSIVEDAKNLVDPSERRMKRWFVMEGSGTHQLRFKAAGSGHDSGSLNERPWMTREKSRKLNR